LHLAFHGAIGYVARIRSSSERADGDVSRFGASMCILAAAWSVGCESLRERFGGAGKANAFERANDAARSRDGAKSKTLDPADDVFLNARSELGAARKRAEKEADSILAEAGSKARDRVSAVKGDAATLENAASTELTNADAKTRYTEIRRRLDAIKAVWGSEKLPSGDGYLVRCEVPHPKDPELAQVFESRSANELSALAAAVNQAEKWLVGLRHKVDPIEADLDPFAP
jgi:hypothetical protein